MAKQRKFKMLQVSADRVNFLEGIAKRRRMALGGSTKPTWGDIAREIIDKFRASL